MDLTYIKKGCNAVEFIKDDPRAAPGTARITKLGEHERVSVNVTP